MAATMTLRPDGTVDDANPEALSLLGVTLPQLRSLPPGAFSPEPPDPEAQAAFRAQWEAGGRPDVGGDATLQRLDGTKVRVRFAIAEQPDGRYVAVLAPIRGSTNAPPRLFTGGHILAEWRAAERRLAEVHSDSPEAARVRAQIERLRELYQDLFRG
jgi:PAS domain-containing protein